MRARRREERVDRADPAHRVAAAELFEDPPGLRPHPQEEALIARAVDKRRREFTSARHCARVALGELGWSRPRCCAATTGRAPVAARAWSAA